MRSHDTFFAIDFQDIEHPDITTLCLHHGESPFDLKLFRRDEIWFIERDHENCSHIYSLAKFKERYDTKLSKAYLEGRYGAIPVLSSIVPIKGE